MAHALVVAALGDGERDCERLLGFVAREMYTTSKKTSGTLEVGELCVVLMERCVVVGMMRLEGTGKIPDQATTTSCKEYLI